MVFVFNTGFSASLEDRKAVLEDRKAVLKDSDWDIERSRISGHRAESNLRVNQPEIKEQQVSFFSSGTIITSPIFSYF